MTDPFSDFSKGKVVCKYQMIEHIGDHKLRDRVFTVLLFVWLVGWVWLLKFWQGAWWPIGIALLPFLFGNWLFKRMFPYRVVGMVEFANERLTIRTDTGTSRVVELRRLRSMRIGMSIAKDFVHTSSDVHNRRAYRMQLKGNNEDVDFHCLNALHLTKEDELQFMSPPPSLISTLETVRDTFKIRFYDLKGKESSLV